MSLKTKIQNQFLEQKDFSFNPIGASKPLTQLSLCTEPGRFILDLIVEENFITLYSAPELNLVEVSFLRIHIEFNPSFFTLNEGAFGGRVDKNDRYLWKLVSTKPQSITFILTEDPVDALVKTIQDWSGR